MKKVELLMKTLGRAHFYHDWIIDISPPRMQIHKCARVRFSSSKHNYCQLFILLLPLLTGIWLQNKLGLQTCASHRVEQMKQFVSDSKVAGQKMRSCKHDAGCIQLLFAVKCAHKTLRQTKFSLMIFSVGSHRKKKKRHWNMTDLPVLMYMNVQRVTSVFVFLCTHQLLLDIPF